jgi:hypothetical protein
LGLSISLSIATNTLDCGTDNYSAEYQLSVKARTRKATIFDIISGINAFNNKTVFL